MDYVRLWMERRAAQQRAERYCNELCVAYLLAAAGWILAGFLLWGRL